MVVYERPSNCLQKKTAQDVALGSTVPFLDTLAKMLRHIERGQGLNRLRSENAHVRETSIPKVSVPPSCSMSFSS